MRAYKLRRHRLPVGKLYGEPFVAGFTDIEKDDASIVIGDSGELEAVCDVVDDELANFKLLCSISAKTNFENVAISAKYKERVSDTITKTFSYMLYDNSAIKMAGFVSEVTLEFVDVIPEFGKLKEQWLDFLRKNKTLYKKTFQTQLTSKNIENFVNEDMESSSIIHTKSMAHCFAGSYFPGIKFQDIQQYLFYVGTGYHAEPYISIIGARELLQSQKKVKLNSDIAVEALSTLEDDVCDGRAIIEFPDGTAFQSAFALKDTLVSDVCQISFKRRRENLQ
jgi:hypothetical protein